jgi:rare lipoprotein A
MGAGHFMKKYNTYLCLALSLCLVSCAADRPKKMAGRSLEYFSEKEYGVKASPRVVDVTNSIVSKRVAMPRGGGRDMVGKPYKVRGKWYYPREEIGYTATGKASWYGDAFHGRLTANGEVYDMNHLSGAHPTMPLPSYARVTNVKNGKSVIVRINDRGPYSHKRLVDLSKRAAELLDYTRAGTATVKMEYVGRAPIEGRDDAYLMASYRENHSDASPVMVAQNDANVMSPQADLSYSEMQPLEKLAFSNENQAVPFSVHSETPLPSRVPLPVVRPDVDIPINGYAPIETMFLRNLLMRKKVYQSVFCLGFMIVLS